MNTDLFGPNETKAQDTHLEEMRNKIAAKYGIENPDQLKGRAMEIQALRDNGLLIAVHCHGTSMFTRRTTWNELGIPKDDPRVDLLRTGMKDIIPTRVVRRLKSLEAQKRQNLDRYGLKMPAFPGFRWVGAVAYKHESDEEDTLAKTDYERWKERDQEIGAQLEDLKADIVAKLDEWTDHRIPEVFSDLADRAWMQLTALEFSGEIEDLQTAYLGQIADEVDPTSATSLKAAQSESRAMAWLHLETSHPEFREAKLAFKQDIIQRAKLQMPSREQVEHGLFFTHSTDFLMNPTDIAQEEADRQEIEALSGAEISVIRAKARAESAKARAEEDIARAKGRTEVSKLQAMREAEIAHAQKRLLEMGSPFQDVLDQVEARLYESVKQMMESVQRNGRVVGKTKELGLNAIEQYQTLRALGGDRLHAEIESFRQALNTGGVEFKTDPDTVKMALETLANETIAAAERVTRNVSPTRARMIDM